MMHEIGDATFWLDDDGNINRQDVSRGLVKAASSVSTKYLDPNMYRAISSPRYKSIIRKLTLGPVQNSFSRQEVMSRCNESEKSVLDNLLRRLRKIGVIQSEPEGPKGEYKFTNQIFPIYIWMESQQHDN